MAGRSNPDRYRSETLTDFVSFVTQIEADPLTAAFLQHAQGFPTLNKRRFSAFWRVNPPIL
jgi:hypothetical protein